MKTIEELAEIAKQAQREYDNAKNKAGKAPKGTIVATSNEEGFVFDCNASSQSIIKHTTATIQSAFTALKGNTLAKGTLIIDIMAVVKAIAEKELQ